jgi:hypothetical protein
MVGIQMFSFSWNENDYYRRVDLKTKARKIAEEINEPCAIVELTLHNGAQVSEYYSSVFQLFFCIQE